MKWMIRGLFLLTLMMIAWIVGAQGEFPTFEPIPAGPNNPYQNELANACYIGGTLSGKCNTTDVNDDKIVDAFDRDWMWNAGWYLIRQEYNMIPTDMMDDAYERILPDEVRQEIDDMEPGCYEIIYEGVPERWILWPGGNSVATAELYFNDQCRYGRFYIQNVVAAETYEEADRICKRDIGSTLTPDRFANSFYRCTYQRPDFNTYPENTGTSSD